MPLLSQSPEAEDLQYSPVQALRVGSGPLHDSPDDRCDLHHGYVIEFPRPSLAQANLRLAREGVNQEFGAGIVRHPSKNSQFNGTSQCGHYPIASRTLEPSIADGDTIAVDDPALRRWPLNLDDLDQISLDPTIRQVLRVLKVLQELGILLKVKLS